MKIKLLMAIMLAASASVNAEQIHWGYSGQEAPERWGTLSSDFSLCSTGKNQSPIDIHDALKTHHSKLELKYTGGKQTIINNGHTVQVNVMPGNTLKLDGESYVLKQFHFHTPSENEIKGQRYPLEVHFVYQNKDDALAVVAVMFKEGKENEQLATLWRQMPVTKGTSNTLFSAIDIRSMLPKTFNYYRFSGSLTTPPCTEGVTWLVLDEMSSVSVEQVNQFESVLHHTNNRPIQSLNGRVVVD